MINSVCVLRTFAKVNSMYYKAIVPLLHHDKNDGNKNAAMTDADE